MGVFREMTFEPNKAFKYYADRLKGNPLRNIARLLYTSTSPKKFGKKPLIDQSYSKLKRRKHEKNYLMPT
jgi:hypothetical protein